MGLSARHVGELVAELRPLVLNARVREVEPLPPRDLLLVLEPPEDRRVLRLRVSADPSAPRFHLQIDPVRRHEGPLGPFYRAARAGLRDGSLRELDQIAADRIVKVVIEGARAERVSLVLELSGRNANMLLVDGTERILSCLVPPAEGSPASERLAEGRLYARPPGRGGAKDTSSLALSLPEPPPREGLAALAPLSWRVEAGLGKDAEARFHEEARRDLESRLERRLAAARNQLRGLEERERLVREADRFRMDGELLLANFARLKRGLQQIELDDPLSSAGATRIIALDPRLSPRENAERLFARYKKLVRTAQRLPDEREVALAQEAHLVRLIERIHAPGSDVEALEREAVESGFLRPRQPEPGRRAKLEPRLPYIRFAGARGSEIRVGRSAADNDQLTFRFAHGNDLWLHISDSPGSHVVLRVRKEKEPDPEEVIDAAHLAIHFSPLRGARKADVHVARCKDVKKPRRAAPGLVNVAHGRIRSIRVESERLARLLDTRAHAGGIEEEQPTPGA